jgi:hypothetical protein
MSECRIELFADQTEYDPIVIIGEIAHVAASSDDGPRASTGLTAQQRNDYDNLILLCQNCHAVIDGQPGAFPVERVIAIKDAHEAWVRASLPERGRSRTGWVGVCLQGDHPIDVSGANAAVSPDFIAGEVVRIQVPTEPSSWQDVHVGIADQTRQLLAQGDVFDRRIAVFPLAPVSACVAFGFHLTSRPHVRLFQYHRDDRSWCWPRSDCPAEDVSANDLESGDALCSDVVFLFHLSARITDSALESVNLSMARRVDLRVARPSSMWLQHPDQVKWVAFEARRAFERSVQLFPAATRWHILFAGPAPIAVAIGQQVNPTMCPKTQLYEYRHNNSPPYIASICLGGRVR